MTHKLSLALPYSSSVPHHLCFYLRFEKETEKKTLLLRTRDVAPSAESQEVVDPGKSVGEKKVGGR